MQPTSSAYVSKIAVQAAELPSLIRSVHASLLKVAAVLTETPVAGSKEPAVSIEKSITPAHLVCLEDGKKFQSLKQHLLAAHGITPADYRTKWGLPLDYPMVAPAYAAQRSEVAKQFGLGASRRDAPTPKRKAAK